MLARRRLLLGRTRDFLFSLFSSQVFIKSELKVGVIYVKEGQYSEEEILDNNDNTPLFDEFLQILGDRVRLKGERAHNENEKFRFRAFLTVCRISVSIMH